MPAQFYYGCRVNGEAVVNADFQPLDPRWDLRNHSPDGFEWGYGGSGPAQLALAILADALQDDKKALEIYQSYKWRVIARLERDEEWKISGESVRNMVEVLEKTLPRGERSRL